MALPDNLSYATITGIFLDAGDDGPDPDLFPDGTPIAEMPVTFTPDIKPGPPIVTNTMADPPVTIRVAPIPARTDLNGVLVGSNEAAGVRLISPQDPMLNENNWTWRVTYGAPLNYSFSFTVAPGETLDLSEAIPIPANPGTQITQWLEAVEATQQARDETIAAALRTVVLEPLEPEPNPATLPEGTIVFRLEAQNA